MQQSYNISAASFTELEIFEKMPCAIKEQDIWYRGRIVSMNKDRSRCDYVVCNTQLIIFSAVVLKIDYGVEKIVFLTDVRHLLSQYGRIPPLVLKCRVKGI